MSLAVVLPHSSNFSRSRQQQLDNSIRKLKQLDELPCETRDELLDNKINLYTHIWQCFRSLDHPKDCNIFRDEVDKTIQLQKNICVYLRKAGLTEARINSELRDPENNEGFIFHSALEHLVKLKAERVWSYLFCNSQRDEYFVAAAQFLRYIREKDKRAYAAYPYLEEQKNVLPPRVWYCLCLKAGPIFRRCQAKRIEKGFVNPVVPKPLPKNIAEEITHNIFDGELQIDEIYDEAAFPNYNFKDLYEDAPDWQKPFFFDLIARDVGQESAQTPGVEPLYNQLSTAQPPDPALDALATVASEIIDNLMALP